MVFKSRSIQERPASESQVLLDIYQDLKRRKYSREEMVRLNSNPVLDEHVRCISENLSDNALLKLALFGTLMHHPICHPRKCSSFSLTHTAKLTPCAASSIQGITISPQEIQHTGSSDRALWAFLAFSNMLWKTSGIYYGNACPWSSHTWGRIWEAIQC